MKHHKAKPTPYGDGAEILAQRRRNATPAPFPPHERRGANTKNSDSMDLGGRSPPNRRTILLSTTCATHTRCENAQFTLVQPLF